MSRSEPLQTAQTRLARAMRSVAHRRRDDLERMKTGLHKFNQPDWFWEALLLSLSTWGNSRGAMLIRDPDIHACVRFGALRRLSAEQRRNTLEAAMRKAKVRMAPKKAEYLTENFDRILSDGGPDAIRDHINATHGMFAITLYLRTFRGIGKKYARNMMMDVYHPDFRNSIAIDARIKRMSAKLNLSFGGYSEEENFYLAAAQKAGLEGWELDRLLYNFMPEINSAIDRSS